MGITTLKNSIIVFCIFLFAQCNPAKNQNFVLSNEFPPIVIMNVKETEMNQIPIYLIRNNITIDTGRLHLYSVGERNVDVQINLNKKDSLYINDKIIFNLKGRKYTIGDFKKKKVESSGDPYLISYTINGTPFVERDGYIDPK